MKQLWEVQFLNIYQLIVSFDYKQVVLTLKKKTHLFKKNEIVECKWFCFIWNTTTMYINKHVNIFHNIQTKMIWLTNAVMLIRTINMIIGSKKTYNELECALVYNALDYSSYNDG